MYEQFIALEETFLTNLFTTNLSWPKRIVAITAKINRRLGGIQKYKYTLSCKTLEIGYITFIRPILEYGDVPNFKHHLMNFIWNLGG